MSLGHRLRLRRLLQRGRGVLGSAGDWITLLALGGQNIRVYAANICRDANRHLDGIVVQGVVEEIQIEIVEDIADVDVHKSALLRDGGAATANASAIVIRYFFISRTPYSLGCQPANAGRRSKNPPRVREVAACRAFGANPMIGSCSWLSGAVGLTPRKTGGLVV